MGRSYSALLIALLPTLSCFAHVGPRSLAGSYRFAAGPERTLPYLSTRAERCDTYITAATLILRKDASYSLTWRDSIACRQPPFPSDPIRIRTWDGRFTLRGAELTLHLTAPDGISVATIVGDTLYQGQAVPGSPMLFGFVRTRPARSPAPSN